MSSLFTEAERHDYMARLDDCGGAGRAGGERYNVVQLKDQSSKMAGARSAAMRALSIYPGG